MAIKRKVGKHGLKDKFFSFDRVAFEKDLKKEIRLATEELQQDLYRAILSNLVSTKFKDNPVKIATSKTTGNYHLTSDAQRKYDVAKSIAKHRLEWDGFSTYMLTVSALDRNAPFSRSHVGLYYEYGTGTKEIPNNPYSQLEESNNVNYTSKDGKSQTGTYRVPGAGQRIVTRSKFQNGGVWRDAGGNLRITKSPKAGEWEGIEDYIGEDIEPHFWFKRGYEAIKPKVKERLLEAIKRIDLEKYIHVQRNIVLGRD